MCDLAITEKHKGKRKKGRQKEKNIRQGQSKEAKEVADLISNDHIKHYISPYNY